MLSIAPCCALDDHFQQTDSKTTVEKNAASNEDCCQECSPFYTCGTCGGFMVIPLISFNTPAPTLLPTAFNPTYLQSFADGMDQNIWQPPKLS